MSRSTMSSLARAHRAASLGAMTLVAGVLLCGAARAAEATADTPTSGVWSLRSWTQKDGRFETALELSWQRDQDHGGSRSWILEPVPGLTREQIEAEKTGVVHFEIRRDAGTFTCDGQVGKGSGAGLYDLALASSYADGLARRGIGRPSREQQIRLALADAGFAFLDDLAKQGYPTPDVEMLVTLSNHGVDRAYVADMGALGYRFDSFEALLKARDHGVNPSFVANMRDAGFARLTYDELLTARDHGVDARYVQAMRMLGYKDLSMRQLLTARDHGVDARFVAALADAGYDRIPLEELIRTRDNGVDGRYIVGMAEAGYKKAALGDLVRARQHGVDGRSAKRINATLSEPASLERLIQIHDRGGVD